VHGLGEDGVLLHRHRQCHWVDDANGTSATIGLSTVAGILRRIVSHRWYGTRHGLRWKTEADGKKSSALRMVALLTVVGRQIGENLQPRPFTGLVVAGVEGRS
jgi:hypothetical protein